MEYIEIDKIKKLPDNPRVIKDRDFKILVDSIKKNQDYFEARPIIVSDRTGELIIIAGNQRYEAAKKVGLKKVPVHILNGLTEEREKEIIIRDNVANGDWDFNILKSDWDLDLLSEWGLEINIKETELLSKLQYDSIYYEPENIPNINLGKCIDLTVFDEKIKAINESNLTDEQKDVLKIFAYRFIKIDFENVANYYYFNANEDEKMIIERLRLVLTDNGINGFIEDHLLRLHEFFNSEIND